VQKPANNKTKGQDKENKQGKRQGNFPEKNTDRHGRHVLDNEDNSKTGNHDEQYDLKIHLATSQGTDNCLCNETPSSSHKQITVYLQQTQPNFIHQMQKSPAAFDRRAFFNLPSIFSFCFPLRLF
jgi:hypothetical protein